MIKDNITVYTVCWNESKLIPYIMDYWSQIAQRIVVFDNGSTDNSIELLKGYPKVEVRNFDTGNQINDQALIDLKNNCWKECRGTDTDWVVVCDMDEIIYAPDGLQPQLETMKSGGYSILASLIGVDVVCEKLADYTPSLSIIDAMPRGNRTAIYSKSILFDPNLIRDINYVHGAHKCRPKGKVKMYHTTAIYILHCKNIGLEYILDRNRIFAERLSKLNVEKKWGRHYLFNEQNIRDIYTRSLATSTPWRNMTMPNLSPWQRCKRQLKYIFTGKW